MPPAAAKNVLVILFDVKTASWQSALRALSDVILYKQLSQSKDQYKLYLVNSSDTRNNLNYEGIHHVDATGSLQTLVEEICAQGKGQSDWLESLDLAIKDLEVWHEKPGIVTLQILFITDLISFERPENGKLYDSILNDLNKNDMFLYIVGPHIDDPRTITSEQDIRQRMSTIQIDKSNSNLKIMKKIINKTPHSVMCNFSIGIHLFHSIKYTKGSQPWIVPLTLGTALTMPVTTARLTKREPPFRLKSTVGRGNSLVNWAYENQQDIIINIAETVSGIVKHGKFVKIESDGRFKVEGPRSFKVLCFTPSANVPEYLLQSDASYLVLPDLNQSEDYLLFFDALIQELADLNMYVIARRVYNKDNNPRFVVLIPRVDFNIKSFVLCQIPYADDIAHAYKEQNVEDAPEIEYDKNILNFLESIDIAGDKCQIKIPLTPPMMMSSSAMAIINKTKEKLIPDKHLEEKFTDLWVNELNCDELKSKWPVRDTETVKKEEHVMNDFDDIDDFNFD